MKALIAILVAVAVVQYASVMEVPPGFECRGYVDTDECAAGNATCGHALCTNTIGGYNCSCDGFNTSQENNLIAQGKEVTMSSQYAICPRGFCYNGSKAVDGIYDTADHGINVDEYISIAHTNRGNNEWIQIDLEDTRCISAVKIWNRPPFAERLQNVLITIGKSEENVANLDINSAAVCSYLPGQPANVQRFNCSSTMFGRYVRATMVNHTEFLNVYEIEVIGY